MQDLEHGVDFRGLRTELLAHRRELIAEIAGLIDEIDQKLPDHPPRRIDNRERELLREVIGKRGLDREEGFDVVVAAIAGAAGPVRIAGRPLAVWAGRHHVDVGRRSIIRTGVKPLRHAIGAGSTVIDPIGWGGLRNGR